MTRQHRRALLLALGQLRVHEVPFSSRHIGARFVYAASAPLPLGRNMMWWLAEGSVGPMRIKRGDIFFADLSPVVGSEQGGIRPVLVVQNDVGNRHSPTVIICAITSQVEKARLPIHVNLEVQVGLERDSVVLLEQIRTIDKRRLREKVTFLAQEVMAKVDEALSISLGLKEGWGRMLERGTAWKNHE